MPNFKMVEFDHFKCKMKTKNIIILSVCLLLAGMVAGWFIRKGVAESDAHETVVLLDTLVVRDTVRERYPVYVQRTVTDTMLVALTDTVRVSDTVYVRLPREQKRYADTNYVAWVSGFRPSLDSIEVYQSTRYVTKEIILPGPAKRWGIGIQAGYGLGLTGGKVTGVPYIGVGISYDLIRF